MEIRNHSFFAPRIVVGLGIILTGVLFLLGNLGIINPHEYLRFWPALLIFIGLSYIIQCNNGSRRMWGIILMFVGFAMLLDRFYFFHFSLWDYWPLILVFVGIMMILRTFSHHQYHVTSCNTDRNDENSYIKAIAVMGGFKRTNNSQDFKGGELTAIMGGFDIDLRDASIKGEAVIDIFTMMGGVSMRVPEDWLVIIDITPFMGGFDDKTRPPKESTKRLVIKGTAIMGGLEIKN
jgi:predicted membrane protein